MTCDEFKAMTSRFYDTTASERAAFGHHCLSCPECDRWLCEQANKEAETMTKEQKLLVENEAKEVFIQDCLADITDEEIGL